MIKLFLSAKIETYLPTKNIPFSSFSRVYYKRYLSANLLFFYYHNSATNQKDFFTCLGQIFTRRTGESHPGQFNRTPAQRTFSSFTICLISFFQVLPFQGNLLRHLRQQSVPARPLGCLDGRRRRPCRTCGWSSSCTGDQLVSNLIYSHHTLFV